MTNIVEFPGLDIQLTLNRVAFTIFGIDIYWYAIIIVSGIILAVIFAMTQVNDFGIDSDRLMDVVLIGIITAIIGGRLYYVIFSDIKFTSFKDVINIRAGGIGIYGAIIGGFIGAVIGCKWRKISALATLDLASMGFLIGQAIGRWANFINQEAFGDNTSKPWGMKSEATVSYLTSVQNKLAAIGVSVDPNMPVHPTFLYESLWCALGFLLLFLYRKHRKFNGELTLMYIFWYGLGRAVIEGLRTDPLTISNTGLRVSQLLAVVSVTMSLAGWIICRILTKGKPLYVAEIPDRKIKVKFEDEKGVKQAVDITWPANTREPSKPERIRLAKEQLEKQEDKEEAAEDKVDIAADDSDNGKKPEEQETAEKSIDNDEENKNEQ